MKTTIQQAIEWVKNNNVNEENQAGDRLLVVDALDLTIFLIGLLPAEREQIEQAHRHGSITQYGHSRLNKTPTSRWQSIIDEETSDYFKTTYSNEA